MGRCLRLARWLLVAVTLLAVTPAAVSADVRPRQAAVTASLGSVRVTGQLAAAKVMHVTVVLRPQDPQALTAYAEQVSDPGSSVYQHYLRPGEFARRFGATPMAIAAVRRALRRRGLPAGSLSRGHLSLSVTATAGALEHGLRISLLKLSLPSRKAAVAASRSPSLGAGSHGAVQAVEGLGTLAAPQPLLVRAPPARSGHAIRARADVATGGPQPCPAVRASAAADGAYTSDQIASAYGFSGVFGAGDFGAGITIAVYELEPVDPADLATYQSCYHTSTSINYVQVDGGAGSGIGTGEAALDIENLLSYAPGAHLLVYQGPNSSSGAPGAGPFDTLSAIVNQDRAQVVSVSWGECEGVLGSGNAAAENVLFEQAAVQGQTVVSAAGDSGSEDCDNSSPVPQPQLAVDDPASQPFVTGVGGTELTALGPRPTENVWNDGGTSAALLAPGAGGGGISDLWAMPAAQADAAPALHVLSAAPTGGQCGDPGGYCREVPDVSANADPATGYEFYWNGSGRDPGQPQGWQAFGGTSTASPVWASLLALADASSACHGAAIGYALPALYRAAGADYPGTFNDVRNGNNDFMGTNSGIFAAGPGYDEASGLGTPNAAALVARLCSLALRLTPVGSERSARLSSVSLSLHLTDAPLAGATLHLTGLPPGLRVASTADRVTGHPRRTGAFHVTVTGRDDQGSLGRESFRWLIGAATRLSAASVSGLGTGPPALSFAITVGRNAPAVRRLVVSVPGELRLRSSRGVAIHSGSSRALFRARIRSGRLQIVLRRGYNRLRVTVDSSALTATAKRSRTAARLTVSAIDASGGISLLRTQVQRR